MSKDREEQLVRCEARVNGEGQLSLVYRWSTLEVDGRDSHDEDVSGWNDDDIRDLAASIIGAEHPDDIAKIQVIR